MENLDALLQDINLLCDKADLYYPDGDPRPQILRYFMDSLKAAESEHDQIVYLKRIIGFLSGGQGSFFDISLRPPDGSELTREEINKQVGDLTQKVFVAIDEILTSHPEFDAILIPKSPTYDYAKLLYAENKSVLWGNNNASIVN